MKAIFIPEENYMVKKSTKILSLVFAAALALVLLVGVPSDSSEGAGTAYVIDGVTTTWANLPASLQDGDILTIMAAAGSPTGDTVINIAANANVTIVGAGNLITDLRIAESASDTQVHTVTISNLKLKAHAAEGYIHYMGSLNVTGAVELGGDNAVGIYSMNSTSTLTITSSNNATLTAKGGSQSGIYASKLSIQGSARVTAAGEGSGNSGINLTGGSPSINVGADAILTVTGGVGGNAITNGTAALDITCNGTINASAENYGLYAVGTVFVTGSGALNLSATDPIGVGIQAGTLTISGVGVLADATTGIMLSGAADITLTDGASLNTKKVVPSPGKGFNLSSGSFIYYTNNTAASVSFPYTMGTAGCQWVLTSATFDAPSTMSSSPASIAVGAGVTGTIKLVSMPGFTGPTTGTLPVGYSAMAETEQFTLTGNPTPTVTKVSGDAKITWNATTNKINVAPGLAANTYVAVFSLNNGFTPAPTLTFTLTVTPATVTNVTVAPASPSVVKGGTQQFTANVTGSGSYVTTVNWTIVETGVAAGTTISATGLLTVAADETLTTLTVKATSTMDPTKSGTATVTVTEPGGGGSSTMLYVAIIIVIVVVILVLVYFFVLKKKP